MERFGIENAETASQWTNSYWLHLHCDEESFHEHEAKFKDYCLGDYILEIFWFGRG